MQICVDENGSRHVQMRSLRERIKELHAAHDAQIGIVEEKYNQLLRQIEDYHQSLSEVMVMEPSLSVPAVTLRYST